MALWTVLLLRRSLLLKDLRLGCVDVSHEVGGSDAFRAVLILHVIDSIRSWKHSSESFICIDKNAAAVDLLASPHPKDALLQQTH